jgi:signal transduction histidine kinase
VGERPASADLHARPTAARARAGRASGAEDLARLFARSAERLRDVTGARAVLAVARDATGLSTLAAVGEHLRPPPVELLAALSSRGDPVDLGRPGALAAEAAAAEEGFGAAAPVGREAGEALAAMLVAGTQDPPGGVRPRTLAALGASARRLESATQAAAAALRLAELDLAVRRLDRLAALGELVAEVAHEVRNPLVSVKTFLQLLPDRVADPEFRVRFHAVVSDEVRRIERLLDGILVYAGPPSASRGSDTAVRPVLETVEHLLAHRALERGIALRLDAPDSLSVPMAADGLRQVILNLALNAIDATPRGGRVLLGATCTPGATEVFVDDEGPGVPEADRERIFEPFFTTKPSRPGGLGLAISRRLVSEAGGELRVACRPRGGASFRACFPTS